MLGTALQPFCGKCCGAHTKRDSTRQKRQARAQEKRNVAALINECQE
jgi:hypothetical protein